MSDADKLTPENPSTDPSAAEDEEIIDLVEEIEEHNLPDSLSPLEQQLLGIGKALPADEPSTNQLPDLAKLDFEEEDQPEGDDAPLGPAEGDSDAPALKENMDWLLDLEVHGAPADRPENPPDASAGMLTENAGFDEPSLETRQILEAMSPSSAETGPNDEDDDLELIEIEDDEVDNELVWLDDLDLDKMPPSTEIPADAAVPAAPHSDADPDLFPETSAADVFAANVASGLTTAVIAPPVPSPPDAVKADVLPTASALPASPIPSPSVEPPISDGILLSAEQVDAAIERIIERKLGGSLESIVLRAVESAVANEIQRLKALLLEDEPDDRIP